MKEKPKTKKPSRQALWARKMRAGTKCQCGKPKEAGRSYCPECLQAVVEKQRIQRGWNQWKPGGRGRPPIGAKKPD